MSDLSVDFWVPKTKDHTWLNVNPICTGLYSKMSWGKIRIKKKRRRKTGTYSSISSFLFFPRLYSKWWTTLQCTNVHIYSANNANNSPSENKRMNKSPKDSHTYTSYRDMVCVCVCVCLQVYCPFSSLGKTRPTETLIICFLGERRKFWADGQKP